MKNLKLYEEFINEAVASREEMMDLLKKKFPNIWIKKSEEFSKDSKNGIWTGSEGETFVDAAKKVPAFNPQGSIFFDQSKDKHYDAEVHKTLAKFLKDHGWFTESYDAATFFFYPINNKIHEGVSKSHNWIDGITQPAGVRKKLEALANRIDTIFRDKKTPVKIELFDSGYCGIHVNWKGGDLYVFDQPGKVGLEDQSMPYILLTQGITKNPVIEHRPDYHSRQFGSVQMEDTMRNKAYEEITAWFETNAK